MAERTLTPWDSLLSRLFLGLLLSLAWGVAPAAGHSSLPVGFADINLRDTWDSVENGRSLKDLNTVSSDWERYVSDCGYRSVLLETGNNRVLITGNDFQVTAMSFSAGIKPDSNLMAVANQIIKQYGQPRQATLRDVLGTVTIDPSQVRHVLLSYDAAVSAEFSVSGAPLWEYRISIRDKDEKRIENKTLRCARKLSKEAKKKSAKKPSG